MLQTRYRSKFAVLSAATLLSFCSFTYELLLAQTSAAVLGGTILRYSLAVGLFLFALGLGAVWMGARPPGRALPVLVVVELTLSILGVASPAAILAGAGLGSGFDTLNSCFWMLIIGLLSGFELPLLMQLCDELAIPDAKLPVLAGDFAGTFLAAIAFPLALFPVFGLFGAAAVTAAINVVIAVALTFLQPLAVNLRILTGVIALLLAGAILLLPLLETWLTHLVFGV